MTTPLIYFPPVDSVGACELDGVTFTTDPGKYSPLQWDKAATAFYGLTVKTIQDGGIIPGTVELGSSEKTPLDTETMKALHSRYRARGATWQYRDGFGNDFVVFVMDFKPDYREAGLWDYTMSLEILSITKFFGDDYTG